MQVLFLFAATNAPRTIAASSYDILHSIAQQVIAARDGVTQTEPIIPEEMQETIYRWLAMFPGCSQHHTEVASDFLKILARRTKTSLI